MTQEKIKEIIDQTIADGNINKILLIDKRKDTISLVTFDEYIDIICSENQTAVKDPYGTGKYTKLEFTDGIWHKAFCAVDKYEARFAPERYTLGSTAMPRYSVIWLWQDSHDEICLYNAYQSAVINSLYDDMTKDKFKEITYNRFKKHKNIHEHPYKIKPYESRLANVIFNGTKTWFSIVFCEIFLLSEYASKDFIAENRRDLCRHATDVITHDRKWNKYHIPVNFLKISDMTLMRDNTLRVTFELKLATQDDIDG